MICQAVVVDDESAPPLFGLHWIDAFGVLKVNAVEDATVSFQTRLASLLDEFADVFRPS